MTTPFDRALERYFAAYAAHDAAGCAAAFAENADLHHAWGAPVSGREAIAALHEQWFAEDETNKSWDVAYWKSDGFFGTCLLRTSADQPGGSRLHGATLAAMEHRDGAWLIRAASITNSFATEDTST